MHLSKRGLVCFTLVLCLLLPAFAPAEGKTKAQQFVDSITLGWNLGNRLDSNSRSQFENAGLSQETCWGNPPVTEEMISAVKEAGFNLIRVPVTWYNHMDENYMIDPAWLDRAAQIASWVIDENTWCIINVHHDTGSKGWMRATDRPAEGALSVEEMKRIFVSVWQQIAGRFRDFGDHLIFEGFNELLDERGEWNSPRADAIAAVNEYNRLFVETVRASGGNNAGRVLIVNPYAASTVQNVLAGLKLPEDSAEGCIAVSVHIYQPWEFTSADYRDQKTWSMSSINSAFANVQLFLQRRGIPVLVGEFGAEGKNNPRERAEWAYYFVKKARTQGIKCVWWDNGVLFRIVNPRTGKVCEPEIVKALFAAANGKDYTYTEAETKTDNLCDTMGNYTFWADRSAGADAEYELSENGVTVHIKNGGRDPWSVQASYKPLTLEKGGTYRVSFKAKAEKQTEIRVYLQRDYGTYETLSGTKALLKEEEDTFSFIFYMSRATENNAALVFNCGGNTQDAENTVSISDLVITVK